MVRSKELKKVHDFGLTESRKLAVQHVGARTPLVEIIESLWWRLVCESHLTATGKGTHIAYVSGHSPTIRDGLSHK